MLCSHLKIWRSEIVAVLDLSCEIKFVSPASTVYYNKNNLDHRKFVTV